MLEFTIPCEDETRIFPEPVISLGSSKKLNELGEQDLRLRKIEYHSHSKTINANSDLLGLGN